MLKRCDIGTHTAEEAIKPPNYHIRKLVDAKLLDYPLDLFANPESGEVRNKWDDFMNQMGWAANYDSFTEERRLIEKYKDRRFSPMLRVSKSDPFDINP